MPEAPMRVCRIYPRMDMGGAENAILQLLRGIDGTHMVVTHLEGMRAPEAKAAADRYTFLQGPRFAPLMAACADASITHLHTINDHLLGPLAAQLAGAPHIVQTIHNDFQPVASSLVDHSIVVGAQQLHDISTPARASFIPNGVQVPQVLPEFKFWCEPGVDRPLKLVELRRPDKMMSLTLEQIATSGALDGLDFEGVGVGFDTPSTHPRIQNIGALSDPYPVLAEADLLIMGTTTETFGRTVYEAMAWGTLPIATPVPAFRSVFSDEEVGFFSGFEVARGAQELRVMIDTLARKPGQCRDRRAANHRRVLDHFSIDRMAERTREFYARLETLARPPRCFSPRDLEGTDPEKFGQIMDTLLSPGPVHHIQAEFSALPPAARSIVLWLLVQTGRVSPDQKLKLLARAHHLGGPRLIYCLDLARAMRDHGDLAHAEAAFAQAASIDAHHVEAQLGRVEMCLQRGNRGRAEQALYEAIASNPGVPYLQQLATRLFAS